MKTKKYYAVFVTNSSGGTFYNPLKRSELYLINTILKENKSVTIEHRECSKDKYKSIFG